MESAGVEAGEKMLGMSGEPVVAADAMPAKHKWKATKTAQTGNWDPKCGTISLDSKTRRTTWDVVLCAVRMPHTQDTQLCSND